jgi:hypothetical protein
MQKFNKKSFCIFFISGILLFSNQKSFAADKLHLFKAKITKLGYLNNSGKIIIPPTDKFINAAEFSEGLAAVENKQYKWGYINEKGKLVIPFQFDFAKQFSEGLALVETTGKKAFINKNGKVILQKDGLYPMGPFSEGLAVATNDGSKFGFINRRGDFIIAPQFNASISEGVGEFSEGLAAIQGENHKTGFIDKRGTFVIEPQFDEAGKFSEGLALVKQNEKYGFINRRGSLVIPLSFSKATPFSDGVAAVQVDRQDPFGFINSKGQYILKPAYLYPSTFFGGLAFVYDKNENFTGFIDKTGKFIWSDDRRLRDKTIITIAGKNYTIEEAGKIASQEAQKNNFKKAIQFYEKLGEDADAGDSAIYGYSLLKTGNPDKAKYQFERVKRISKDQKVIAYAAKMLKFIDVSGSGWLSFAPKSSGFSVLLPKKPELESAKLNTPIGTLNLYTYTCQGLPGQNGDNMAYSISYSDYPASVFKGFTAHSVNSFLNNAVTGAIANSHGKLTNGTLKNITLNNYPGREYSEDLQGNLMSYNRIYLINHRMYILQVLNFGYSLNNSGRRFFDSFKLVK